MPYISPARREVLIRTALAQNVGELTYLLTLLCVRYWDNQDASFATHAEITAALDHARHEWFRRMVARHEDAKCAENGDVYPTQPPGD